MKQGLLNSEHRKKKRSGIIQLCTILVMIGAITVLAGCMDVDSKDNSTSPGIENSTNEQDNSGQETAVNNNTDLIKSERDAAEMLAEEQAKVLEAILFYGVGESQHVIDTDEEAWQKLLKKVNDKAAQEESFRFLQENRLDYDRAFYTDVVGVKINDDQNKLIFTMHANLIQGITRDFSLDVYMIKENNEWTFEDFGNLYVEEYDDSKGITIKDETFLENYRNFDPS